MRKLFSTEQLLIRKCVLTVSKLTEHVYDTGISSICNIIRFLVQTPTLLQCNHYLELKTETDFSYPNYLKTCDFKHQYVFVGMAKLKYQCQLQLVNELFVRY